jgi:cytochrome c peroxidase
MQQKQNIIGLIIAAVCVGLFFVQAGSAAKQDLVRAKANLGRHLFYDTKLSYNLTKSCVSCHDPKMAFTDGYRTSSGADGYNVKHNAMSLLNVKYRTNILGQTLQLLVCKCSYNFRFLMNIQLSWVGKVRNK